MKFNLFGAEIRVSWTHIAIIIAAAVLSGAIILGLDWIGNEIIRQGYPAIFSLVLRMVFTASQTLLIPATIFLIGKYILKGIDKDKIKSLCAANVLTFLVVALAAMAANTAFSGASPWILGSPLDMLSAVITVVYATGPMYILMTAFYEWNGRKIYNAVIYGLVLAAICSALAFLLLNYDTGTGMELSSSQILILAGYLISLTFFIIPLIYYLEDKETLNNFDLLFGGAFVVAALLRGFHTPYLSFEIGYVDYRLLGLIAAGSWWKWRLMR